MAISNKYNLNLEALRGVAAVLVFFTHLTGPQGFINSNSIYLPRLVGAWGTEAVIIFFVLSGIVIHASFDKKPRANAGFLANRIIRLHPILILAVALTVVVDSSILHHTINTWQVIGNIIPVSSFNAALAPLYLNSNPVIWSLSFEMFFYMVFAIGGIYKTQINRKYLNAWFIISIICIIGYYCISSAIPIINYLLLMMAFSSIWLIGFFIWYIQGIYRSNIVSAVFSLCCLPLISRLHITDNYYDPIKYLIFAISSIPFFIYLCQLGQGVSPAKKRNTLWLIITIACFLFSAGLLIMDHTYKNTLKATYIFLPFCALLFYSQYFKLLIKKIYYGVVLYPFSYIGKISYSIYLIHFPILVLIGQLAIPLYLKAILSVIVVLSISLLLENHFQPFIKNLFNKLRLKSA